MKKCILLLFLIFSLSGCSKKQIPPIFIDTQGHKIIFSSLKGKWVFINYWATWCTACLAEIPQLNKFYFAHKDNVILLGVNYDSLSIAELNNAIAKFKIGFPVLTKDPAKTLHLESTDVVPTTYVFNPTGNLVKILRGPQIQSSLNKIIESPHS